MFREKKKACAVDEMEYLVRYGLNILGESIESVKYWSMTTFNNPFLQEADIIDYGEQTLKTAFWKEINFFGLRRNVLITNHHLSHAGIYLTTGIENVLIVTSDGGGDVDPLTKMNECNSYYLGRGNSITRLNIDLAGHISGKTYGACAMFLYGAELHSHNPPDGKMMALAGLGKVRVEYYDVLEQIYREIEIAKYEDIYQIFESSPLRILKGQALRPTNSATDFAATVQEFFVNHKMDDISSVIDQHAKNVDGIIMSGGVGLNLELNSRVAGFYKDKIHFVAPCCDDSGQSLGSLSILINNVLGGRIGARFPYLGEGVHVYEYSSETIEKCIEILLSDGILLVHNGRSEVGPRALGNRSFIARPDSKKVRDLLSERIKERESYRPLAPIVLESKLNEYFTGPAKSPFMLYKYEVKSEVQSKIPGALHVDGSARVQTITKEDNPFLCDLISLFFHKTGIALLLNTSLNFKGMPLTNSLEDTISLYEKINYTKGLIYNGKLLKSEIIKGND